MSTSHQLKCQPPSQYRWRLMPASGFQYTLAIVKTQAGIASGEAQTPELPLMQELARNQASGRMRLNVCMSETKRPREPLLQLNIEFG